MKKQMIKYQSDSVGFVATMGALHGGHIELIKQAKKENDIVVVSIFVNPTQFLENEDLDKYPKNELADSEICKVVGVDYLFIPSANEIYTQDEISILANSKKSYIFEGYNRPRHFDGVLQIVLKLFNIINPTNAYFGKKDAQQLFFIHNLVNKLFLSVNIVECEIVRDSDGLAKSSRNIYLSSKQRESALSINASLIHATKLIQKNITNTKTIKEEIEKQIEKQIGKIDYVEIVNRNFDLIDKIEYANTIIVIAVRFGNTRLLDNVYL